MALLFSRSALRTACVRALALRLSSEPCPPQGGPTVGAHPPGKYCRAARPTARPAVDPRTAVVDPSPTTTPAARSLDLGPLVKHPAGSSGPTQQPLALKCPAQPRYGGRMPSHPSGGGPALKCPTQPRSGGGPMPCHPSGGGPARLGRRAHQASLDWRSGHSNSAFLALGPLQLHSNSAFLACLISSSRPRSSCAR